jgi:hypothetical protein
MQMDQKYKIIGPVDGIYTAKWNLENLFTRNFPGVKISDQEYSLLKFDGIGSDPEKNTNIFKGLVRKMQSLSGNSDSYSFSSPDAYYEKLASDLKNTLIITHKDFFQQINIWEQNVKSLAIKDGALFDPNLEIFVKVFIFIRLGYTTNYKKLADIFEMPIFIYVPFEKLFKQKINLK